MPEDTSSESHHANQNQNFNPPSQPRQAERLQAAPKWLSCPQHQQLAPWWRQVPQPLASAVVPESVTSIASIFDSENLRIDSEPIAQLTICGSVGRSAGLACRFSFGWLHFSASGRRLRRSRRRGWYGLGDRRGRLKHGKAVSTCQCDSANQLMFNGHNA